MDFVDDFHAVNRRFQQLLGELLVIERVHATTEDDTVGVLLDLQAAEIENTTATENRLGLRGYIRKKNWGHPSLTSVRGRPRLERRSRVRRIPCHSMSGESPSPADPTSAPPNVRPSRAVSTRTF